MKLDYTADLKGEVQLGYTREGSWVPFEHDVVREKQGWMVLYHSCGKFLSGEMDAQQTSWEVW